MLWFACNGLTAVGLCLHVFASYSEFEGEGGGDDHFEFDDAVADRKTDLDSIGASVIPGLEELDNSQPEGLGVGLAGFSSGLLRFGACNIRQ